MKILNKKKHIINKVINNAFTLKVLGLFLLLFLILNRLYIRLPKKLPLSLNFMKFILIFGLLLCFISFLILTIITISKPLNLAKNSLIIQIKEYFQMSLDTFDYNLKEFLREKFNLNYKNLNVFIINMLLKHSSKSVFIYFIFMLPKIILPIIFLIDVFHFSKLGIFYILSVLLILPMIYKYIYYNLHKFYCQQIEHIDRVLNITTITCEKDYVIFEDLGHLGSHFYIQEHTLDNLNIRKNNINFDVRLKQTYIDSKLNNKTKVQIEFFYEMYCKNIFPTMFRTYEILYYYTIHQKNYDIFINILSFLSYIIGWSFILITADYSFFSFTLLNTIKENIEPFSQLLLNDADVD